MFTPEDKRIIEDAAKVYIPWFDLEEDAPDEMVYTSREYGDVGSEEPGEKDITAAREFLIYLMKKYGYQVGLEVVDEWVSAIVQPS